MGEEKTTRGPAPSGGLSYRAVAVGLAAMLAMALWIQFHEVLVPQRQILAENSPPASAVGVLLGVVLVGSLLGRLRGRLRLSPAELVVVYTMLVTSAPLMSQGMWHRFVGLVTSIPHDPANLPLFDRYSDRLWPHGPDLLADGRFRGGPPAGVSGAARLLEGQQTAIGRVRAVELANPPEAGDEAVAELRLPVPRRGGREPLVPGERYFVTALARLSDLGGRSWLELALASDAREESQAVALRRNTAATFGAPGGYARVGSPYVAMPRDLRERVDLVVRLHGPGRAAVTDLRVFSNEALARLYKGSTEVRASDLPRVPANDRDALLVRPDRLASPAGLAYVLKGYGPYRQWLVPLAAWTAVVLAVFAGLLGLAVVFRRQWAEHERFAFPLAQFPRMLIEQREAGGRVVHAIFGRPVFRAGFGLALAYALLQGAAYYVPGLPALRIDVDLASFFTSPAAKAVARAPLDSQAFQVVWLLVAIAVLIDRELLASILVFFLLAKVPAYLGEVFGWKAIRGPFDAFPFTHEQHIGAFLGLAAVTLWASRRHLGAVGRRILGRPGGADDAGEAMSYRAAAALVALAFGGFALWGAWTGLGAGNALVFFGFLVACGFVAARIRTECGAPVAYFTPYYPFLIFFLLGGLRVFSPQTMLLTFAAGGFMAVAQFLMMAPTQVEMLHLGGACGARPRAVAGALTLGVLGGVLLGGYVLLVWAYGVGGENIPYMKGWTLRQNWYFEALRVAVREADASTAAQAASAGAGAGYSAAPLAGVGAGAAVPLALAALRARFVGFWLHPIGYVLANAFFIQMCWGSLLVAWAIKSAALRIGGPRLVREQLTPFFVGVFCGGVAGMVLWDAVGSVAMARGAREVFTCLP